MSGGTVYFEWTANPVADLAGYRLYKGSSSSFFPLPANLIGSTTVGRFYFPGTPSDYFKLVAVDVNGNESTPVPNVAGTVGVRVPEAPQFALHGAGANPARGGRLAVMFSLPDRRAACLEVCDVAGRLLRVQDVESFGPGTHTLDLSNGGRMPAGLYFVRLTQGGNRRSIRITVLD